MTRMVKGRLCCGWVIAYPTIGTGGLYEVTAPERPGPAARFDSLSKAERWAERHDLLAEAMGPAVAMNLAPRTR